MVCFSPLLSAVLLNLQYLQAAHMRTDTHTRANTFCCSFCLSPALSHTHRCRHTHAYVQRCSRMRTMAHTGTHTHAQCNQTHTTIPAHMAHSIQNKNLHGILAGVLRGKSKGSYVRKTHLCWSLGKKRDDWNKNYRVLKGN